MFPPEQHGGTLTVDATAGAHELKAVLDDTWASGVYEAQLAERNDGTGRCAPLCRQCRPGRRRDGSARRTATGRATERVEVPLSAGSRPGLRLGPAGGPEPGRILPDAAGRDCCWASRYWPIRPVIIRLRPGPRRSARAACRAERRRRRWRCPLMFQRCWPNDDPHDLRARAAPVVHRAVALPGAGRGVRGDRGVRRLHVPPRQRGAAARRGRAVVHAAAVGPGRHPGVFPGSGKTLRAEGDSQLAGDRAGRHQLEHGAARLRFVERARHAQSARAGRGRARCGRPGREAPRDQRCDPGPVRYRRQPNRVAGQVAASDRRAAGAGRDGPHSGRCRGGSLGDRFRRLARRSCRKGAKPGSGRHCAT